MLPTNKQGESGGERSNFYNELLRNGIFYF